MIPAFELKHEKHGRYNKELKKLRTRHFQNQEKRNTPEESIRVNDVNPR
jgi:hypothetical protein